MSSQNTNPEAQTKSKRPIDSAFKQQRLPAWQPVLTAGTVLPTFFIIGIAFIPVGVALLYFSDQVSEKIVDYTDCLSKQEPSKLCADIIEEGKSCTCDISFNLEKDFLGTVYMYYGLSNYYQNHRRYVKSRDDEQLLGKISREASSDCKPFDKVNGKTIVPCGAIANSLFNDTLSLRNIDKNTDVELLRKGIAWPTDKNVKFRNPPDLKNALDLKYYDKPIAWNKYLWELDPDDEENNGFQNEDFIVWMRTAALPTFRKLYRRVDHQKKLFASGLIKGNYTLTVEYRYPVKKFDGRKRMILSTTSLLGGKNPFLGIAYIVVGCLCLTLGIALLFIHIKCSKSTTEMINVASRSIYS